MKSYLYNLGCQSFHLQHTTILKINYVFNISSSWHAWCPLECGGAFHLHQCNSLCIVCVECTLCVVGGLSGQAFHTHSLCSKGLPLLRVGYTRVPGSMNLGPKHRLMDRTFKLKTGFLELWGVKSWDEGGGGWYDLAEKWCRISATSFFFHALIPNLRVNSFGPKFCSWPIGSLDFWVSLVLDPSVNPPLTLISYATIIWSWVVCPNPFDISLDGFLTFSTTPLVHVQVFYVLSCG